MKLWKDDEELFAIARNELFTALVGDSLEIVAGSDPNAANLR